MNGRQGTLHIVGQMHTLLNRLDNTIYTKPLDIFHQATVGAHMRHILEFYICLLEGAPTGTIDYSSRKRNELLSSEISAANTVLVYLEENISSLDELIHLQIKNEYGTHEDPCIHDQCHSSVGRELQYAFDHAIHHLAIIRMGIESCWPDIKLDQELGIAPSTLKYNIRANAMNLKTHTEN